MKWRAWYSDGDSIWCYTSAQMDWSQLPNTWCQMVKVYQDREWKPGRPYTITLDGCDWYFRQNDVLEGLHSDSWEGYREKPDLPPCEVKRGTGVPDDVFAAITMMANEAVTCP